MLINTNKESNIEFNSHVYNSTSVVIPPQVDKYIVHVRGTERKVPSLTEDLR